MSPFFSAKFVNNVAAQPINKQNSSVAPMIKRTLEIGGKKILEFDTNEPYSSYNDNPEVRQIG